MSLTLTFLLFITLMSILHQEVYSDPPSFFREIISDKQKDINIFPYEGWSDNTSNLFSKLYNFTGIPSLIDIDKIIYSTDGKELNITLFWDMFSSQVPYELYQLRDFSMGGPKMTYTINVYLDSGPNYNQNSGFDYVYQFGYQPFLNQQNIYTFDPGGFEDVFGNGNWTLKESELVGVTNIFKHIKSIKFVSPNHKPQELRISKDHITLTIDLTKIGSPTQYSFLLGTSFYKGNSYRIVDYSDEIHVPIPELLIENNKINIEPGITNLNYLSINETHKYNINTSISSRQLSEDINIDLPSEKNTILGGIGSIPISVYISPDQKQKNYIVPLSINYSVLDETPISRKTTAHPYQYNQTFYLNVNLIPEKTFSLINFNDIPQEYIAIFVGAVFTFFIPSAARLFNNIRQNHNSSNHLKKINKIINNKKNIQTELKKNKETIMDDYIKGKINNEQYQTLNQKLSEYTNQFDKDYHNIS